jgi:putative heme-binding domain-containing protein
VLSSDELTRVDQYLTEKYPVLKEAAKTIPPTPGSRPLELVKDPPAIQTFVPGFTVKRLPLDLTNINNLRYRPDGKLVALAYDGNVYVLSDTDGDGLEDHAELFWDNKGRIQSPIGMALTPPGYARGDGLFIACKGKLSLVVDTDHDGKADKEIVVATGWPLMFHQVDALGVAIDPKDGSIYFGLGTTNFADPFLIDPKDGKSHYDIKGERGTIQRVAPDYSKRETVCTGVRFSVGMSFNSAGDLFCTDQEGATWVPNGNPFDELLHIQPGRHYGFPARHPKHLPNVIDEPSTFDYAPQHQSTCGLVFNEPVNGGPVFGPESWRGDAIVTGYSRAKLYRTKLVKTPVGYVAENQILACGTMMLAEASVTPAGDLVVCAHGGRPDWGNGPAGKGALFKILYTYRAKPAPQPTLAYAAGPREVRVAFDRPLDPAALHGLATKASIDFGDAVAAGDRFESVRPGYDAVKRQLVQPRFGIDVHGAAVSPDRRTLILQTAPMSRAVGYALTLAGMKSSEASSSSGAIAQVDALDLAYSLNGVEASFTPDGATTPSWTGWLPHLDLVVVNAFTQNSAEHDAFRAAIRQAGKLRLRTQLDLDHMLRPRVQPGSQIDFEYPPENVTLTLSGGAVQFLSPAGVKTQLNSAKVVLPIDSPTKPVPLDIELTTFGGDKAVRLEISYHTNEDARERPMELRRFILPWATPRSASDATIASKPKEPQPIPELAGGSWSRGRAVFHSEKAMCAKCHRLREDGTGKIGPDLSNLHERDYASVLQDVVYPSAAINPDHVAYTITLVDGNVLAGVPRPDGESAYIVGEPGGKETRVERSAIKKMEALPTSIMPHGIDQVLGPAAMKDLMTFLLAPPLEPAKIEVPNPPPARTMAEVEAVLGSRRTGVSPASPPKKKDTGETPVLRKLRVLLVAGPKDHGIGEHDYPLWQRRWSQLLSRAENVEVDTAWEWPTAKQFEAADVAVFFSNNAGWSAATEKAGPLDAFQKRGGGVVLLHYAVNGRGDADAFASRVGLAWKDGGSKFRHGAEDLTIVDKAHPITRGFEKVHFVDETYWSLTGDASKIHVLATSTEDNAPQPQLWTFEPPGTKARVFACLLGHYNWTFDDPLARIVMLRGIAWCAHDEDVERLSSLATVGARIEK